MDNCKNFQLSGPTVSDDSEHNFLTALPCSSSFMIIWNTLPSCRTLFCTLYRCFYYRMLYSRKCPPPGSDTDGGRSLFPSALPSCIHSVSSFCYTSSPRILWTCKDWKHLCSFLCSAIHSGRFLSCSGHLPSPGKSPSVCISDFFWSGTGIPGRSPALFYPPCSLKP